MVDDDLVDATRSIDVRIMIDVPTALAGNVLYERSAKGNVRDLNATTDCECRNSTMFCLAGEHQLAGISRVVDVDDGWMRLRIVVAWVQILASGEQEARDSVEHACCELRIRDRWNDQGHEANRRECLGVRLIHAYPRESTNDFGGCGDGNDGCTGHERRPVKRLRG